MTESDKTKGALVFLYIGKLVELGLIDGNPGFALTTEGFNLAIDAHDKGERLSDKDLLGLLKVIPGMEESADGVFIMIKHMQQVGFDKVKEEVEAVKSDMAQKNN